MSNVCSHRSTNKGIIINVRMLLNVTAFPEIEHIILCFITNKHSSMLYLSLDCHNRAAYTDLLGPVYTTDFRAVDLDAD